MKRMLTSKFNQHFTTDKALPRSRLFCLIYSDVRSEGNVKCTGLRKSLVFSLTIQIINCVHSVVINRANSANVCCRSFLRNVDEITNPPKENKKMVLDRRYLGERNSLSTLPSPVKPKPRTKKTKSKFRLLPESDISGNTQKTITDYFPIRRSIRKTGKTVLEERRQTIREAVLSNKEDGLEVRNFEGKGRGVVTTRNFVKGEFVVEYAGELISMEEAQKREAIYARNENIGCYMYYFKHKDNPYCIDATAETGRLGRLLNHSKNGNLCTKTIEINGIPRLILLAKENIDTECELTYDYGDRSKQSLEYHPWLAR